MDKELALLEHSRLQREAFDNLFTLKPDDYVNPREGDPDHDSAAWRQHVRQLGANFND